MKPGILQEKTASTRNDLLLAAFIFIIFLALLYMPGSSKADFTVTDIYLPAPPSIVYPQETDEIFSELSVIKHNELNNMRGGLNIGGTQINIAALLSTLIDGQVVLETQLNVSDTGNISNITTATELPGATVISNNDSNFSLQDITAKGISLDGLQGGEGIVLNDNQGYTAVINNIQKNRFLSAVINRASNRNIQHRVEIDVSLKNFRQLQITSNISNLASRLSRQ